MKWILWLFGKIIYCKICDRENNKQNKQKKKTTKISPQLAWYTGSSVPDEPLYSTGSSVTIVFYSDQLLNGKGFTLEYTACMFFFSFWNDV